MNRSKLWDALGLCLCVACGGHDMPAAAQIVSLAWLLQIN